MAKKDNDNNTTTTEPAPKVDLSEFEREGFIRLNPEPRYWNADGAGTLFCVVLDRASMRSKKLPGENAYYTCIAMRRSKNGPIINPETGDVTERDIEPGDTIRVGARHQIDDTFPRVCGKAAMVAIKPLQKVATGNNREVWQFAIMAKPLTPEERAMFAQFNLSDFESL
jgi:hypothetical protein